MRCTPPSPVRAASAAQWKSKTILPIGTALECGTRRGVGPRVFLKGRVGEYSSGCRFGGSSPRSRTANVMSDEGSCVTLIFYRINPKWWKEPALNPPRPSARMSNLTHCELSIGEETSNNGQTMKNVARSSTTRSVSNLLNARAATRKTCSSSGVQQDGRAEDAALRAAQCVGKPFSNYAMVAPSCGRARPRTSRFFVPSSLRAFSRWAGCSTATATRAPPRLKCSTIYSPRAAAAANPVLRELNGGNGGAGVAIGSTPANGFIGNVTLASASPSARRCCRRTCARARLPTPRACLGCGRAQWRCPWCRRRPSSSRRDAGQAAAARHFQSVNRSTCRWGWQ